MKLKMDVKSIERWFWTVTLVLIIAAAAGWAPGHAAVMLVCAVQAVIIAVRSGRPISFLTRVGPWWSSSTTAASRWC